MGNDRSGTVTGGAGAVPVPRRPAIPASGGKNKRKQRKGKQENRDSLHFVIPFQYVWAERKTPSYK